MTLKGGERRIKIFWRISIITLVQFDLSMTEFGMVTQAGGAYLGVSHAPIPRWRGPSVRRIVCDLHACTDYAKQQANFA